MNELQKIALRLYNALPGGKSKNLKDYFLEKRILAPKDFYLILLELAQKDNIVNEDSQKLIKYLVRYTDSIEKIRKRFHMFLNFIEKEKTYRHHELKKEDLNNSEEKFIFIAQSIKIHEENFHAIIADFISMEEKSLERLEPILQDLEISLKALTEELINNNKKEEKKIFLKKVYELLVDETIIEIELQKLF